MLEIFILLIVFVFNYYVWLTEKQKIDLYYVWLFGSSTLIFAWALVATNLLHLSGEIGLINLYIVRVGEIAASGIFVLLLIKSVNKK